MKLSKTNSSQSQFLLLMLLVWLAVPTSVLAQIDRKQELSTKFLKTENPLPNRYIVVLDEEQQAIASIQSSEQVASIATNLAGAYGGAVDRVYSSALKGFSVAMSEEQAAALSKDTNVKYVVTDGVATISQVQNNPPWGLDRIDQRDRPLNNRYSYTATGAGVRVYVIDTGVLPSHPEFGGRASVGTDIINDGQNGVDCQGHGTHVAGTVAGNNVGVAKNALIVGVRVLDCTGNGTWSGIIAGIDWVRQNRVLPAVANMSLQGQLNPAVNQATRNLINSGVTTVVAAGNWSTDANNISPASTLEAITVGASDINDVKASFSNYGTALDLFAPGVNVYSAWSNGGYNTISGTSMASPHVAGVAALYLQANPGAAPAAVGNAITSTATPNRLSSIGPGSPNLLLYSLLNRGGWGGDVHFISYGNGVYDWQGPGCYDVAVPANPAGNRFRFQVEAVPFAPNPNTTVGQRTAFTFPETNSPHSVILSRTAPHLEIKPPLGGVSPDTTYSTAGNVTTFREIGGAQRVLGTIVVRTHSNGVIEYSAETANGTNFRAFISPNVVVDATVQPGWNQTHLRGMAGVLPLQSTLLARGGQSYTIETLRTNAAALNEFSRSWACPTGQSLFETDDPGGGQAAIITVEATQAAEQACEAAGVPRFAAEQFQSCVFDVVTGGEELGQTMANHAGTVWNLLNQAPPQACLPSTELLSTDSRQTLCREIEVERTETFNRLFRNSNISNNPLLSASSNPEDSAEQSLKSLR